MMRRKSDKWRPEGALQRWVDYPTLLIVFGTIGLCSLWPKPPVVDAAVVPRAGTMVVASAGRHDSGELFRRPDLIVLPSVVSFSPEHDIEDPESIEWAGGTRRDYLLAIDQTPRSHPQAETSVELAAAAVREIDCDFEPRSVEPVVIAAQSTSPVTVVLQGNLRDASIQWTNDDIDKLFYSDNAWEVELSVVMNDDSQPEEIFIEKQNGAAEIAGYLVRVLRRPDRWVKAARGRGKVLVSFSPVVINGEHDED